MISLGKSFAALAIAASAVFAAGAAAAHDGRSPGSPSAQQVHHDSSWRGSAHHRQPQRYDRYGRNSYDSRVVKRRVVTLRNRAQVHVIEEAFGRGRGSTLVCTVDVRGPGARYTPPAQVRAIARNTCSRSARIRFV